MSQDRDSRLESLFADAQQEFVDENFSSAVMNRIEARGRRVLIGRLAIAALLIAFELLMDSPLQNSVGALTEMLGTTLFDIEHEWLAFTLAPVNSIAGLLGLTLVGLHLAYRKFFY
ncbi:MAG: hypothetical protein OES79_08845 [Planctomycetota bacterium]|nr:hypothetical protein [Planctomycetota bacterium]